MADMETEPPAATPPSDSPPSPSASDKSGGSSGSKKDAHEKFHSLLQSIKKNIETFSFVSKEVEKINDRILFHSSAITPAEESTSINKVAHLHKDTSMKARDTSRMIKNLRREIIKPTGRKFLKRGKQKTEEEKAQAIRDMGVQEEICKTVSKQFTDELLLYQSAIQDFKNELKERLTKRVQSIRPKASEDFIDLSLRSESSRYALFREIMAADEKDLSEEDAKALKDEIAEKYIIIAELSNGASELNKIFLDLASANSKSLSDSSDSEDATPRQSTRSRNSNATASSTATGIVDDLLGSLNPMASPARRGSKMSARSTSIRSTVSMDASTTSSIGASTAASQQGKRRNRLFAFMKRHRNSSPAGSTDVPRVRKRRGSRWMTLFLLATVAVAAMAGIVMFH